MGVHLKQGTDGPGTSADRIDTGTDGTAGTDTGTKGTDTGTDMTKIVVFGIAVILAVVAVAAVVAVLGSGKAEDEVAIGNDTTTATATATTLPANPVPGRFPEPTPQEVFMQTNNSFHGGVVIKVGNEFQKVVGYDIIGGDAAGENKTLQMETLAGASVFEDVLKLGETSYERHTISPAMPKLPNAKVPGLYASRQGDATTTGWFDEAAEVRKLGNSLGILAFSYQGPIFVGVKLIGDTYVPAGEESTRVNMTDGTAEVKWAYPGYRDPNWKPSKLDIEDELDKDGHFKIITAHNNREYYTEFIPLDEMTKVDAGVAVRFAHPLLPLEKEGP